MGVVTCSQLTKKYRNYQALSIENLEIRENSLTGLIGRNGAGKTTLLKLIAGFSRPTSGEVKVFGRKSFDDLTVSANSFFVDDQITFPGGLTLGGILLEMARFYPNWDQKLATKLCKYFNLNEQQNPKDLSKGKKSTFNMIIGLSTHAQLTILDEPITGMDVSVRKDFYRLLLKSYLAHPRTIIVSSHHLNEMEGILENIILLDQGSVVFHLPVDDVQEYAVGVSGEFAFVTEWAKDKEVLYKEEFGSELYVVIKRTSLVGEIARRDFKITAVSPTDLAIYLTNKTKGGIEDVLSE